MFKYKNLSVITQIFGVLMARPLWFVELLKKVFPQISIIAKLTRVPIIGRIIDQMLFEGDDIIYLPKNEIIEMNQEIKTKNEMILPSQVVEHFIEKSKYRWIMNFCICRAAQKCKDYPIDLGCLFLGEAVIGINPQLGKLVSKEEALEHVRKCREAGLIHLIGRNKLDSVWLNVKPGDKLLTICNCDPCCCLWRILPHVTKKIGNKVTRMPGVKVTVTDKCTGCGICIDTCFVNAITISNKKAVIGNDCRACGRCALKCPNKAINITIPNEKNVIESIKRIESKVNVK